MDRDFNPIFQRKKDEKLVIRTAEKSGLSPLALAEGLAKEGFFLTAGIFLSFVPDATASKPRKAGILAEAYINKTAILAEEAQYSILDEKREYYLGEAAKAQQIADDLKSISQSGQ